MMVKNPPLFVTAPIKIYKKDLNKKYVEINATATGFFYKYDGNLYFITNRHVIIDEYDGFYPDEIRLKLHTNPEKLSESQVAAAHPAASCGVLVCKSPVQVMLEQPL